VVKVHLDTDLGGDIDDLCALALMLRLPDVELVGVTTVAEHGGKRAGYVRYVLALAGRADVAVAAGTDITQRQFAQPTGIPAEERFWPDRVTAEAGRLESALELLERNITAGATVIAIGPLTNLALLEQRQRGILRQASLCLMAGHVRTPPAGFLSWDHTMDYNVQADPEAALLVLQSSTPLLVPIEVTVQTALRRSDVAVLRSGDPLCLLLAHQAEATAEPGADFVNYQHDPVGCAVAVGWPGVEVETLPLTFALEDGLLRMREELPGQSVRVATAVDAEAFSRYWLETVMNRS
jgi:inosine-uridine nucleoside N-ribohydrolase